LALLGLDAFMYLVQV